MRCLRHHEQDAVGVCRHCGGGVCADCATPVEDVLSCPAHTAETAGSVALIQRNVAVHGEVNWLHWMQLAMFLLVGAGLAVAAVILLVSGEPSGWALAPGAIIFLVLGLGIARWIRARNH